MTWLRKWWMRRRHVDTTAEARGYLRQLEGRDAEISALSEELREAQRTNHFSDSVYEAIQRTERRP